MIQSSSSVSSRTPLVPARTPWTDPVSLGVWWFPEPLVWLVTGLWIVGITNACGWSWEPVAFGAL